MPTATCWAGGAAGCSHATAAAAPPSCPTTPNRMTSHPACTKAIASQIAIAGLEQVADAGQLWNISHWSHTQGTKQVRYSGMVGEGKHTQVGSAGTQDQLGKNRGCVPCANVGKRWVQSLVQLKLGAARCELPASRALRMSRSSRKPISSCCDSRADNTCRRSSACSKGWPCKCQRPTAARLSRGRTSCMPQEVEPGSLPCALCTLPHSRQTAGWLRVGGSKGALGEKTVGAAAFEANLAYTAQEQ